MGKKRRAKKAYKRAAAAGAFESKTERRQAKTAAKRGDRTLADRRYGQATAGAKLRGAAKRKAKKSARKGVGSGVRFLGGL